MKFGLFGGAVVKSGGNSSDSLGYEPFVDVVLEAESLGFHSMFLVEHHFGAGWFVANGGSVCSTWRIGRVGLEAVRAFSQLRGLSGLLWSVITPSARDQLATVDFQAGDIIILKLIRKTKHCMIVS